MSTKSKKPDYYRTPLRSRAAIADFLLASRGNRKPHYDRDYGGTLLFCWDVKLYDLDLSFDHLLEKWKTSGYGDGRRGNDEKWIAAAKEVYDKHENDVEDWGREDACRQVKDSDTFSTLWDGTEVDVEYGFAGRSGGYLSLGKFNGLRLLRNGDDDVEEIIRGTDADRDDDRRLPNRELRKLYQLVVMLDHDITPAKACAEVEYQAAFNLFENACSGIPVAPLSEEDVGVNI